MRDGFIRVAAATPGIRVADPVYNREAVEGLMREAAGRQVKAVVFPELCLTGYTCGDLFLQDLLLEFPCWCPHMVGLPDNFVP